MTALSFQELFRTDQWPGTQAQCLAEIQRAIFADPENSRWHVLLLLSLQEGPEELAQSDRVVHHARRAAILAPHDKETLNLAGEALVNLGLLRNRMDLWREGVKYLRQAWARRQAQQPGRCDQAA
jgi:hypothetical protein